MKDQNKDKSKEIGKEPPKPSDDFTEYLEWDEDTQDDFIHLIDTDFNTDQD